MQSERRLQLAVLVFVVFAHVALLRALLMYAPSPYRFEPRAEGMRDAIEVVFIQRASRARPVHLSASTAGAPAQRPAESVVRKAVLGSTSASAPRAAETVPATAVSSAGTLDLAVHPQSAPPAPERSAPWERHEVLPAQRTRFESAWVPSGNALDQASFHSKLVAGALGAFGGPPRHCTQVERRLLIANCLPEEEALLPHP